MQQDIHLKRVLVAASAAVALLWSGAAAAQPDGDVTRLQRPWPRIDELHWPVEFGPAADDRQVRWVLGVQSVPTTTGVLVTFVYFNSPAAAVGLEPGDLILAVNRARVGWVQGLLYPLGRELQIQADLRGWVTLVIEKARPRRVRPLLRLEVQLQPILEPGIPTRL